MALRGTKGALAPVYRANYKGMFMNGRKRGRSSSFDSNGCPSPAPCAQIQILPTWLGDGPLVIS